MKEGTKEGRIQGKRRKLKGSKGNKILKEGREKEKTCGEREGGGGSKEEGGRKEEK